MSDKSNEMDTVPLNGTNFAKRKIDQLVPSLLSYFFAFFQGQPLGGRPLSCQGKILGDGTSRDFQKTARTNQPL